MAAWNAASNSLGPRASSTWSFRRNEGAAASAPFRGTRPVAGSQRTATRETFGATSVTSSSHLPPSSGSPGICRSRSRPGGRGSRQSRSREDRSPDPEPQWGWSSLRSGWRRCLTKPQRKWRQASGGPVLPRCPKADRLSWLETGPRPRTVPPHSLCSRSPCLKDSRMRASSGLGGAGLKNPTRGMFTGCWASAAPNEATSPSRTATRSPPILGLMPPPGCRGTPSSRYPEHAIGEMASLPIQRGVGLGVLRPSSDRASAGPRGLSPRQHGADHNPLL